MMLVLVVSLLMAAHGSCTLLGSGAYEDAQWMVQVCCETGAGGETSGPNGTCRVQNLSNGTEMSSDPPPGSCLDIRCWLDDEPSNVTCYLRRHGAAHLPGGGASLGLWLEGRRLDDPSISPQVHCAGADEVSCSVALRPGDASVSLSVSGRLNGFRLRSQELHISVDLMRPPAPPSDLHYNVTAEGDVVLSWRDSRACRRPSSYQLRRSSNTSLQHWEVFEAQDPWVSLGDLGSGVMYTVQVRCGSLHHPGRWTDWSHALHLSLDVSYIPAELFTRPGEDVTVLCVLHNRSWNASRAVWVMNGQLVPESHYRVLSDRVSAVTLRSREPGFHTLMCSYPWGEQHKWSIPYTKVYTEGLFEANITCQADQRLLEDSMTCEWNTSVWALVRLLYRRHAGPCEEALLQDAQEDSGPEECVDKTRDLRRCTLPRLSLFSCYRLWLEVEGGRGRVRSHPVFLSPIDHVKPAAPSLLDAETYPNRTLSVSWRRPLLPAYELQYELRHAPAHGPADSRWKVSGPLSEPRARVLVDDPCSQYQVQARCRRLSGSGYWSDWSDARVSTVRIGKAPDSGPDFWRVIPDDASGKPANVTLLLKIPPPDPRVCVQGLVVVHRAPGGRAWSTPAALGPFHAFQWAEPVHTVTVMFRNSAGSSARNRNMTLEQRDRRPCVRWFRAVANASCVSLTWTLDTWEQSTPESFVVEWPQLGGGVASARGTEWRRVPGTTRDLHLCGHFHGTEEFRLYPVFVDGEGEPARCTLMRKDPAAYMLLTIIAFLAAVLFVTLLISQNQLKKLLWKDVPNPSNCSWARGMDLSKVGGTGRLIGRPGGLVSCPLLPAPEYVCEVATVERLGVPEDNGGVKVPPCRLPAPPSPETTVSYSAVLVFGPPVPPGPPRGGSPGGSSDEGNFTANDSEISGSPPTGNLWELENAPPRSSASYNSTEEFSEASEHEDGSSAVKELYYMGMDDEGGGEGEGEGDSSEGSPDSRVHWDESEPGSEPGPECEGEGPRAGCRSRGGASFYLPQFRTAAAQPAVQEVDDSAIQL